MYCFMLVVAAPRPRAPRAGTVDASAAHHRSLEPNHRLTTPLPPPSKTCVNRASVDPSHLPQPQPEGEANPHTELRSLGQFRGWGATWVAERDPWRGLVSMWHKQHFMGVGTPRGRSEVTWPVRGRARSGPGAPH